MSTVYVLSNTGGDVLYVGCTRTNVFKRLSSMRSQRPWFDQVDMSKVAIFNVAEEHAGSVEHAVISLLQPRHNIDGISRRYARPPKRQMVFRRPERNLLAEIFFHGLEGAFDEQAA